MSNLENVATEVMRAEIKKREAKELMQQLEAQFGEGLSSEVERARHLLYIYKKAIKVLSPPSGRRGRKAKTS